MVGGDERGDPLLTSGGRAGSGCRGPGGRGEGGTQEGTGFLPQAEAQEEAPLHSIHQGAELQGVRYKGGVGVDWQEHDR